MLEEHQSCFMQLNIQYRYLRLGRLTWWIVHNTAVLSAATVLSSLTNEWAEKESRPEVGSSRNNKEGCVIISTPTDVLFL